MSEPTHFEKFVAKIMSDDDSPLARAKAERDYALHCLEREIAIAHQDQARIEALEAALRDVICDIDKYEPMTECWQSVANARAALHPSPLRSAGHRMV